jgi:hypothetical protein
MTWTRFSARTPSVGSGSASVETRPGATGVAETVMNGRSQSDQVRQPTLELQVGRR